VGDDLPVVWPAEPHTKAKHAILIGYLKAWAPILSHQAKKVGATGRRIRFIDAFAGPGVYEGGEDGSPVLAVRAVLDHPLSFPLPIHCLFIEEDKRRFDQLQSVLALHKDAIAESSNISLEPPVHGDCTIILNELLDQHEANHTRFGPALVFLDQTGYSSVPISLIARIMKQPQCEVFAYLNYKEMNRFLSDPAKDAARTKAFGTPGWERARDLVDDAQYQFLLRLYRRCLHECGHARYVWDFAMADESGRPLYWLFFCTNNDRGLEVMKKAMWGADPTGTFRFSDDQDPSQLLLLEDFHEKWLGDHLLQQFGGRRVTVGKVRLHVLTQTPCYKYAKVLQAMQRDKKLKLPEGVSRVAFNKNLEVEVLFADPQLFQT
jgi:three-Cys-motif partner protein